MACFHLLKDQSKLRLTSEGINFNLLCYGTCCAEFQALQIFWILLFYLNQIPTLSLNCGVFELPLI